MARIFITGSADGLGKIAAQILLSQNHQVLLHARNNARADTALKANPTAEGVVTGDLSSISETIDLAKKVNALGPFDAVIHNAAAGYQERRKITTVDGLAHIFAINSLSPYILTALIRKPQRLVYLSSGLHTSGDTSLHDLPWNEKPWNGFQAYSDSKFHNVLLAFAIARKWKDTFSNALNPGWVPTKMGGPGAPDSLQEGAETQAWLAAGADPQTHTTANYFYHKQPKPANPAARNEPIQDEFLKKCFEFSGVPLP